MATRVCARVSTSPATATATGAARCRSTARSILRWAMLEATMHALRHPAYADRYQTTKRRLGKQRGARVAQIDIARRLTEAIWHMLTRNQPFAPAGAPLPLAA